MKATKLIRLLEEEIALNGDSDVYFEYDSTIIEKCRDIVFIENIPSNFYNPNHPRPKKAIIINHDFGD